ncbi:MAG: hypothetical protein ACYS80_16350 [Planctomycetota bacterium]|jgi:hypothetical protein
MPDKTFEYNGAKITIRHSTGRDALYAPVLNYDLVESLKADKASKGQEAEILRFEWASIIWYTSILMRSTVEGKLPFEWPDYNTITAEQLFDTYNALMDGDIELVTLWRDAAKKADLEVIDPEE